MSDLLLDNVAWIGGLAAALVAAGIVLFVWSWRQVDRSWQEVRRRWSAVDAALKERGSLIPGLVEITRYRLVDERDSLEVLGRLRARSIGGRTREEKAKAEAELEATLTRILGLGAADAGLGGSSEFESARETLEAVSSNIREASSAYNRAALRYNRMIERFPGSMVAAMSSVLPAEYFGDAHDAGPERREAATDTAMAQ